MPTSPFERWPQLDALFQQAIERPREDREAFLDTACAGDTELRAELLSLLASHDEAESLLEDPDPWLGALKGDEAPATVDPLPEGRRVGHYRIETLLGAGGMGVVYKARDMRLNRPVTLKFLQPHLVADAEAKARFVHEARAASALDHANICTVYDVGETDDGQVYIAMAYYGGETLRARLARGPLALDDALRVASAIGAGLSRAHEAGIVHRDLKPANVMLTERGEVKLLDFGIAKLEGSGAEITKTGTRMGTVAYMSPEQARGERVDQRTDVWALGVVLTEMLAGERPFRGDHEQAVIHGILNEEPALPANLPDRPEARAIITPLNRALAKSPAERFDSMAEFVAVIDDLRGASQSGAGSLVRTEISGVTPAERGSRWRRWVIAAVLLLIAVGSAVTLPTLFGGDVEPASPLVIRPLTTLEGSEWAPSWSPDGSQVAFAYSLGGSADVYVMAVGGGEPRVVLDGPHDEMTPRWSPDGTQLAFVMDDGTGTMVNLVPATGGPRRIIAQTNILFLERWDAVHSIGSNPWSPSGNRLAFSRLLPNGQVAVWTIDLATRQETQVTFPERGSDDLYPAWSNDGEWIAFSRREEGRENVWRVPASGGQARRVSEGMSFDLGPAWSPDDEHVVFYSDRSGPQSLWDVEVASGALDQLTSGVDNDMTPVFSADGRLMYVNFSHVLDLMWLDLTERDPSLTPLTRSNTRDNFGARVAPDGRRIVFFSNRSGRYDIWLLDRETGDEQPLTDDAAADYLPDWSPDGRSVVFMSNRAGGGFHLWRVDAEGGPPRQLTEDPVRVLGDPTDVHFGGPRWSPDGATIGIINFAASGLQLSTLDPSGGPAQPTGVNEARGFDWYLDSRRVLYTRQSADADGTVELVATHLTTGDEVVLTRGPISEIDVAPDGSAVAYLDAASHFNMNLFSLPLTAPDDADGLPRPAGPPSRLTNGNGVWHVHSGGWAPDSRAFLFTRDLDRGDIFVIDNYR